MSVAGIIGLVYRVEIVHIQIKCFRSVVNRTCILSSQHIYATNHRVDCINQKYENSHIGCVGKFGVDSKYIVEHKNSSSLFTS